jgi:hypothetical protein
MIDKTDLPDPLITFMNLASEHANIVNKKDQTRKIILLGSHAMKQYGLDRYTADVDIHLSLEDVSSEKELDFVEAILKSQGNNLDQDTFQPYGVKVVVDGNPIDWFNNLDFSKVNDIPEGELIYQVQGFDLILPSLEKLMVQKVAAFDRLNNNGRHAIDIDTVWKKNKNKINIKQIKSLLIKYDLVDKWHDVVNYNNEMSLNSSLPQKL